MANVSLALARYLGDVGRRPFQFGRLDCCTFMADWLVRCGFEDPMSDRRFAYSSHREYRAMMRSEGGIIQSCSHRFAAVGLAETHAPKPGDVCLVKAPARFGRRMVPVATGAICVTENFRAMITPDMGLVVARADTGKIWSLSGA